MVGHDPAKLFWITAIVKSFDTVRSAKLRIENYAAERLFDKDTPTSGVVFSLSNNSDCWTEKREETVKLQRDGAAELASALLGRENTVGEPTK